MSDSFNYNDLLKQFKMIKRMGSISKILGFLPGVGQMKQAMSQVDDKQFDKMTSMISSMTEEERKDPKLIDSSSRRRERIARGSGMSVADLNRLRQALEAQKKMMKQMSNMDERQLQNMQKNPSQLMGNQKVKKVKEKERVNSG